MTERLEKAREILAQKMSANPIDESVLFIINGEGALLADQGDVSVVGEDSDADVTLTADSDVFEEILNGDLNGTSAFMSGKLKIDGNMGIAMKLGSILA